MRCGFVRCGKHSFHLVSVLWKNVWVLDLSGTRLVGAITREKGLVCWLMYITWSNPNGNAMSDKNWLGKLNKVAAHMPKLHHVVVNLSRNYTRIERVHAGNGELRWLSGVLSTAKTWTAGRREAEARTWESLSEREILFVNVRIHSCLLCGAWVLCDRVSRANLESTWTSQFKQTGLSLCGIGQKPMWPSSSEPMKISCVYFVKVHRKRVLSSKALSRCGVFRLCWIWIVQPPWQARIILFQAKEVFCAWLCKLHLYAWEETRTSPALRFRF